MSDKRKNILLFFTDQQRYDTIGAIGNPYIKTPNLDRLVNEGIAFTNAFSPSPVCVPARASLHYGQYPGKTKCFANAYSMPDDRKSYADILSEAGYETISIGKCHFTPDRTAMRGFKRRLLQEECPACVKNDDYLKFLQESPFKNIRDVHGVWGDSIYQPQTSPLPVEYHPSQWVGDRMTDFIDEQANDESQNPWFAFCSFIHPHPPYSPPAPWDSMYDPDKLPDPYLPEDFLSRQNNVIKFALQNYYFDPPISKTLWRLVKSRYYACISFLDHQIGRVLDTLEKNGQLDNTIIIFASDHGEMLGDIGLIGKEDMYGPSSRIPLLLRCPDGSFSGRKISTAVNLVDVTASILNFADLEVPSDFDGQNLMDFVEKPEKYEQRITLSQVQENGRGIYLAADSRYKLTYSSPDDRECLHEYAVDKNEEKNLIDDPKYADIVDNLRSALFDYLRETHQEQAMDAQGQTWTQWPKFIPKKKRSRSNTPCRWAERLGIDTDMSVSNKKN